jgi:hypothetical protein
MIVHPLHALYPERFRVLLARPLQFLESAVAGLDRFAKEPNVDFTDECGAKRRGLYFGSGRREHFQVLTTELHIDNYRGRRRRAAFPPQFVVDMDR